MPDAIGPYRIEGEVGRGGMGVVYRAVDTRLQRVVAIKALPEDVAHDAGRLARFEREARTLASLNHRNLAGIHGVEEQDGRRYLVLEFVDGSTLEERLDRSPLPVDEAIEICRDIAGAMEVAHNAGIVHRDLKPANIKITPDGTVKVLDFGLAKSGEGGTSASSSESPTMTTPPPATAVSIPGAVLGTAAYMSPEQARGRAVDRRTDVWALGVILYECLTGRSPFAGESAADSIGAVLHKDIDFAALPPGTPPRVRDLLGRMLERDRQRRLRDVGDAMLELELARTEVGGAASGAGASAVRRGPGWPLTIAAAGVGVAGLAVAAWSWRRPDPPPPEAAAPRPAPIAVRAVRQATDFGGQERQPALSPDGATLLYVANDGDDDDIFALRIGGFNAVNLTADSDADDTAPRFSPDGQSIAFRSSRDGGGLYVMGATGESPRRLTDFGFDPDWSPDGRAIVFATAGPENPFVRTSLSELWTVRLDGGEPTRLAGEDAVAPAWNPRGDWIAAWTVIGGQRDLVLLPAAGGKPTLLTDDVATDWSPTWSPDGSTLYFVSDRGGGLNVWRLPIDLERGAAAGPPEPVTAAPAASFAAIEAASRADRLAVAAVQVRFQWDRLALDPTTGAPIGEPTTIFMPSTASHSTAISPDGTQIAYVGTVDQQEDLFVMRADGTGRRRLTNDSARDRSPEWSADGRTIVFQSNRGGDYELWSIRADGSGLETIDDTARRLSNPRLSPDGTRIAAMRIDGPHVLGELVDGAATFVDLPPLPGARRSGLVAFSPDSRSLLMQGASDAGAPVTAIYDIERGAYEMIEIPEIGRAAAFMPDGRRVLCIARGRLLAADPTTREVETLYTAPDGAPATTSVVVAPDGSWVLMVRVQTDSDVWVMDMGAGEE